MTNQPGSQPMTTKSGTNPQSVIQFPGGQMMKSSSQRRMSKPKNPAGLTTAASSVRPPASGATVPNLNLQGSGALG